MRMAVDKEGRFEMVVDGDFVIAMAPGFGLGYYLKDQPIRLTAGDMPIAGRLVNLEGRPVAGATVRLLGLQVLDPQIRRKADTQHAPYRFPISESIGMAGEPALPGGVITDADGRFRIAGLGLDTLARLQISGPGIAFKRVQVLTRAMNPIFGEPVDPSVAGVDDSVTYGANCTIVLAPSRPIEGVVVDVDTREPIPGAVVTLGQLAGSTLSLEGLISTTTDARGHYRLDGVPGQRAQAVRLSSPRSAVFQQTVSRGCGGCRARADPVRGRA